MESKGEARIREILSENHLIFEKEYSPPGLLGFRGKPLRYDFAVFNKDMQIDFLIEYDGKQHFEYIEFFSKNKQKWDYIREMDVRKNKYALMSKIPLYRIPYIDFEKLNSLQDILQEKYLVKTKWDTTLWQKNKN